LVYRNTNQQWQIRVRCEHTGGDKWGKKEFCSLEQAKLRSFDAHQYSRDQLGWGS